MLFNYHDDFGIGCLQVTKYCETTYAVDMVPVLHKQNFFGDYDGLGHTDRHFRCPIRMMFRYISDKIGILSEFRSDGANYGSIYTSIYHCITTSHCYKQ